MCGIKENFEYKIEFVDRILDPVHGFVDVTQVEKEIIELPIFKRLQSLKQLSLTNWVFPGAEHTRYMHSLGVMHIADLMAINLKDENYRLFFNDKQRQLLRLAGLLHDIGHYPLSHVTEHVYLDTLHNKKNNLFEQNLLAKEEIDKLKDCSNFLPEYMKSRYTKPMHHETIGTNIIESDSDIKRIINKYCPFVSIDQIKDIIVGCVDNSEISAMVQLIHSELDADGIDYIMRDATFSGTSYGSFELGLLLRNLVVKKYNGIDIVGIRPKGISVVDQYLISKYFSYTQVIFNRHVTIYDKMAEMFSQALISLDSSSYPQRQTLLNDVYLHSTNSKYIRFTDRAFWAQVDQLKEEELHGYVPECIVAIHNKLLNYQEFDSVKQNEIIITSNKPSDVYTQMVASDVYKHLLSEQENLLITFQKKGFTSEIPESNYKQLLSSVGQLSDERFFEKNTTRLQEGISIIEPDKEIKLLVDDPRSIMSHLYDTCTYILYEFTVI